jgi:hypothetical protein
MAPRPMNLGAALEQWPTVADERSTLETLLQGWSLARFGDGEFKSAYGREQSWQPPSAALAAELREVLWNPAPRCAVGIPTMDERGPKIALWRRLEPKMLPLLNAGIPYGSAFIGRPDHAPWIIGDEKFIRDLVSLWRGKVVAAVYCPGSIGGKISRAARQTRMMLRVECPELDAYSVIDRLEDQCLEARRNGAELVLISCGVTATCLANRLARQGMQAIDVGTLGKRLLEPVKGDDEA